MASQYLVPGKYGRPSYTNETVTGQFLLSTPGYINTSVSSTATSTGTIAFGGIAFASTGSAAESGVGNLAFGPAHFAGVGTDKHTATAALHFAGISIVATGAELGAPGDGKRFFWTL